MNTRKYLKCDEMKPLDLNQIYNGDANALATLKNNLLALIETEAPITLNTIKARIREVFGIAKISSKALDIILPMIKELGFTYTNELFDIVFWPLEGRFTLDTYRIESDRELYDVPKDELKLLVNELSKNNKSTEALYYAVLNEFGHKSLTQKAQAYLDYVCK